MTDKIILELWNIKDNIAKEYSYDINKLAAYYQSKQKLKVEEIFKVKGAQQVAQPDAAR